MDLPGTMKLITLHHRRLMNRDVRRRIGMQLVIISRLAPGGDFTSALETVTLIAVWTFLPPGCCAVWCQGAHSRHRLLVYGDKSY